jgi:hypothetical protein
MFQVFYLDVGKLYLRCCIYCNDNIRMLQVYVLSVSGVSDVYFKCLSRCCICCYGYTCMFQVYVFECFRCFRLMLQVFISKCCKSRSGCCICCYGYTHIFYVFHLFQTYVASVLFGCFKSRSQEEHMLQLRGAATAWVNMPPGVACMRAHDHAA